VAGFIPDHPFHGVAVGAAYLGKSAVFDEAIAEFAEAYADQSERDHAALREAADAGRIEVAADPRAA
jgi:Uncharacterized protein conserved in bacteria (DUF2252)